MKEYWCVICENCHPLAHVSVQTTERYLGCKQRLREAVNDKIRLETSSDSPGE